MTLKSKLTTSIVSAALLATSFAPAAFADTIEIVNNGADSTNVVNAGSTNVTWVKQKNKTAVVNLISAKAKTGKNKSNKNTGGNVNVLTGNAASTVGTTVTGSSNTFNQTGCCEPIPLPE